MTHIKGTTKAQTLFLRAFRSDPHGPSVEKWPSPAILRRWLRRPGFCEAMASIRDAMRYQADFQLLSAAASAAHAMHTSVCGAEPEAKRMKVMNDLMKLAHVRERFATEERPRPKRDTLLFDMVCTGHENASLGALRTMFKAYTGRDIKAEYRERTAVEMNLPEDQRSIPPAMIPLLGRQGDGEASTEGEDERRELKEGRSHGATYVRKFQVE
jgi:hypothetical protein